MGLNYSSYNYVNFEDIKFIINEITLTNSELNNRNKDNFLLINTLNSNEQKCLIKNTCSIAVEENMINNYINNNKNINIIIYGKNSSDISIIDKYNQLISLGFKNVFLYSGGLFEWLLLQDIYGDYEFPTTKKELDILKYKPNKLLNIKLLEY